jgi:hypothetical protein
LFDTFSSVVHLLNVIINGDDGTSEVRLKAEHALESMKQFCFVFCLVLMIEILSNIEKLSVLLQKKKMNFPVAATHILGAKAGINNIQQHKFNDLMSKATSFCRTHGIQVPIMTDPYVRKRGTRKKTGDENMTFEEYYKTHVFNAALDGVKKELDERFNDDIMQIMSLAKNQLLSMLMLN